MEIPISNWTTVKIRKTTLRMINEIAKKYETDATEIVTRLVEADYAILISDKKTYGDFKIK